MATLAAVRVGELACQKNSFLRELSATVVSCEPAAAPAGKKKDAAAAAPVYDVVLSDSVLFPEGGGQPCDHGTLSCAAADGAAGEERVVAITNVQRRGDTCVLSSPTPLPPGTTVHQAVDWSRRLDHMQHHTAQHLLTAVVERRDTMFLPTISWSLTHPFCFIQLDLSAHVKDADSPYAQYITKEKKISDDMIKKIQQLCNDAIVNRVAVQCDVFESREAYQSEQQRREAAASADGGQFRSRGIPADVNGAIRIITLDGIDSCTCCGTHLTHLAQLQTLQLLHQEVKGNTVKLYFITGQRAEQLFSAMYSRERQLMVSLSGCRPEDFVETIQHRSKTAGEADKKLARWQLELAGYEAQKLIQQVNGKKAVVLRRDDVDEKFFAAVRSALDGAGLQDIVLVAAWATEGGAAAAANTILPTKDVQGQVLVNGASKEAVEKASGALKATLTGVKGGLSKMGFRGKGSLKEWNTLVEAMDSLQL